MDWNMNLTLLLPELILCATGLGLVLLDLFTPNKRLVAFAGLVGALAALAAVAFQFGESAELFGQMIRVDPFAHFFKLIFYSVAALVFLISPQYVEQRNIHAGEFYALVAFATLGASLMASSLDLIAIYVSLEMLSLASYALTGMLKNDERSSEASIKFFLIGAISSAITLYGASLIYGVTGTTYLPDIAVAAEQSSQLAVLIGGMLFLAAGLGVKIAAVPFHMWAVDAYDGAPTPISAFLITVSEAAGFATIARIFLVGLPSLEVQWGLIFALLALITMTYGNVTAIAQTRTKRMLAYSAVAQAGYVLVGIAVATPAGLAGMLFYLLVYAFMTLGTFAIVVALANRVPSEEIEDFKGLAQRNPLAALALTIYLLSLIGFPPTAGFLGKFVLFRAAVSEGYAWLALAMVLNSVISVPYYYKIIRNMYLKESEEPVRLAIPAGVGIALGVTLVATIALGVYPEPLLRLVSAVQALP